MTSKAIGHNPSKGSIMKSLLIILSLFSATPAWSNTGKSCEDPVAGEEIDECSGSDDTETSISASINHVVPGSDGPILFKPFKMVDPNTGDPVEPNGQIELPGGKKIKAQDYYRMLNGYEKELNQQGYTLRGRKNIGTVVRINNSLEELEKQKESNLSDSKPFDDKVMSYVDDPEKIYDDLSKAGKEELKDTLTGLYRDLIKSGNELPRIHAETPSAAVVLQAEEGLLNNTHKEWNFQEGHPKKLGARASASLDLQASLDHVDGAAKADAVVQIMGKELPLVKAEISGSRRLTEDSKGVVVLEFVGKEIYRKVLQDKALAMFSKKSDSPPPKTVRTFKKYRFSIGPVPMSAEIGAAGQIGYDWTIAVANKEAAIAGLAYADVSAYAQMGVDAEIVSAGAGGNLVIVRDTLKVDGRMGVVANPTTSKPEVVVEFKGSNEMTALKGDLYAYVRATVPTLGIPPYETKQWNREIFKWEGLDTGGEKILFNFKRIVDRNGWRLSGSPTEDDYAGVEIDAQLEEELKQLMEIVKQEGALVETEGDQAIGEAVAVRKNLETWISNLN
jgi:hypothetical protein